MSLVQTVIQMVRERGSATVDDLAPLLPQYTRAKVMQALQNGAHEGWLKVKRGRGLGTGKGSAPSRYSLRMERKVPKRKKRTTPAPRPPRRSSLPRVCSVFALGAALAANDSQRARA